MIGLFCFGVLEETYYIYILCLCNDYVDINGCYMVAVGGFYLDSLYMDDILYTAKFINIYEICT